MNTPLTSGNARIKGARKLSRRSERFERRLFLADGPKAVEGALSVPGCVVEVFVTEHGAGQFADLLADQPVTLIEDRAMHGLSDAVTPAGVLALCEFIDLSLDAALDLADPPRLLVIAADVRDPGNAGTLIRTADAAGAQAVVLAGHSVDAYNPKTVRATVGSLFNVPVVDAADPADVVRAVQAAGYTVLAADGAGEIDLFQADELLRTPTAWLFGNEAWGLPDELASLADHRVSIPILGAAESLNLATAAAICLYASARAQRPA